MQLSLALDTQQRYSVAIRDIDIRLIEPAQRPLVFEALQKEYDLLRRQTITDLLPLTATFWKGSKYSGRLL